MSNERQKVGEMESNITDLIAENQNFSKQVDLLSSQVVSGTTTQDELKRNLEETQDDNVKLRQELTQLQTTHEAEMKQNLQNKADLEENLSELQVPYVRKELLNM